MKTEGYMANHQTAVLVQVTALQHYTTVACILAHYEWNNS